MPVSRLRFDAGQVTLDTAGWQYDVEWTAVGDDAAIIGHWARRRTDRHRRRRGLHGNTIIGYDGVSSGILNIRGPGTLWRARRGTDWYSMFIGGNGRAGMNITDGGTVDFGAGSVATHYSQPRLCHR